MDRRQHLVFLGALLLTPIVPAQAKNQNAPVTTPDDIVNAIYARAARGNGDSGGSFVYDTKADRSRYLSRDLRKRWAAAEAHTKKGDIGPVEFDPVTNSQDPSLKSYQVARESLGADAATIMVTVAYGYSGREAAADKIIRYDFVRENDKWVIDDIRGAIEGKAWSIRQILAEFMKY